MLTSPLCPAVQQPPGPVLCLLGPAPLSMEPPVILNTCLTLYQRTLFTTNPTYWDSYIKLPNKLALLFIINVYIHLTPSS